MGHLYYQNTNYFTLTAKGSWLGSTQGLTSLEKMSSAVNKDELP